MILGFLKDAEAIVGILGAGEWCRSDGWSLALLSGRLAFP